MIFKIVKPLIAVIVVCILAINVLLLSVSATNQGTLSSSGMSDIPTVESLQLNVKSAILIEQTTGVILLSINADQSLAPASMVKMMTEYIVAKKVRTGELFWDDIVTVSNHAARSVGSRAFLAEGDQHTVKELYTAMAVGSANDAAIALSEHVSGTEQNFVTLMNEEATRMGLTKTHFINATGLSLADMPEGFRPDERGETLMSAKDVATLAKNLIQDEPDYADVTSLPFYKLNKSDKEPVVNSNRMLENYQATPSFAYEGLDGLKTGYTKSAGYCFTGTAKRDGMRLISVVMGTPSMESRFEETAKVLDYGFNHFTMNQVIPAGSLVTGMETSPVKDGKQKNVQIVTKDDVYFIVPKSALSAQPIATVHLASGGLAAPVAAGTKAGTATFTYEIEGHSIVQTRTVDLITERTVEKENWFMLLLRSIVGWNRAE
ncbi:D-alanyl-D-alanine carboxypeptidase family protein [Paenibacillus sp. KS-LC4]|uniref:D-alanyl-D-alanine carboxypeptidase family protein n=1 Tax=Paenibacillus sp. KS-LC4 TaxID=2979727 RepID=UPI0030CF3CD1